MSNYYPAAVVAVIAIVTVIIRFIPFVIFRGRKTPETVSYFGKVLPTAIMGMLVVYCLRNTEFTGKSYGIPEIVSCILVVCLHKWKRNTLLSIVTGTVVYMILTRVCC